MRFLTSGISVMSGISVWGGLMTHGPHKGEEFCGSVPVDVTFRTSYSEVDDTLLFAQTPHKVSKFGDCTHFKVSGTVYCPSNNGLVTPSLRKSVFGPTYDQEGVGTDILSRSATGSQYHVTLSGRFNNCSDGEWAFALGAKRVGNRVFTAWGNADLIDSYRYAGYYTISLHEYRDNGSSLEWRSTTLPQSSLILRTASATPYEAIARAESLLLSMIESSQWYRVDNVYSLIHASIPNLTGLSPDRFFPPADRSVRWGELASDAYSSVPFFKSNGIAYSQDLINLKKSAKSTIDTIASFGSKGRLAAKAANLFLSFYYGWRLMISDTQELVDAYQKAASLRSNLCKATSQRSWVTHGASYVATFQCFYDRYSKASGLDRFILDNDLALTPENLWDLVPFSFVVDWFTGIGNILEDASNYYNMVQKHNVVCSGRSIKATRRISARDLCAPWVGEILISYYDRWYTKGALSPTFHFSNSVNPLDHAIEGSALIVSRR